MIRTESQLLDAIARELVWRRKELTELRALAQSHHGETRARVVVRAAVALLYAHWEGFVKKTSAYYLEFVAAKRLTHNELAPNFLALALRKTFVQFSASRQMSSGNALAQFLCTQLDNRAVLPFKDGVDTRSNLSSKVFSDILSALGLDSALFATRMHFLDGSLLDRRNHIAHGESIDIELSDYLQLHDDVMDLVELFRNEVENACVQRRFQRSPPSAGASVPARP